MDAFAASSRFWTYPWDVQDIGLPATLRAVRERAGVGGISLAAAYHAGYFLQPASPRRRLYLPEDGTVYYQPDPARWAGRAIHPVAAAAVAAGDVLAGLRAARDRGGPEFACWTVCLHNSRLGALHPEATVQNAFGDRLPFSLCPSHPGVRDYASGLVAELGARYRPGAIEVETPGFMGFAHGHHHEKDGVGLQPEDDYLLSLCFCPSCLDRAHRAGVDGPAAQRTVRHLVQAALERPVPQPRWPAFRTAGLDEFRTVPEIWHYASWRTEPVTSLVAEMRARLAPDTKLLVIQPPRGWRFGMDPAALARQCDGLVFCAYDMDPAQTRHELAAVAAVMPADAALSAGMRLFWPEVPDAAALADKVAASRAGSAQGAHFYNFGLIPAARLDWVKPALAA